MKIPAPVLKIVASPGVRKAFVGLVLAVLAALGVSYGTGCKQLSPAEQAKLDLFDCRVHALAPLAGPVLDTEELVRDLYSGKADLGVVIVASGATEAQVRAALAAMHACDAPVPPADPGPDAGTVVQ